MEPEIEISSIHLIGSFEQAQVSPTLLANAGGISAEEAARAVRDPPDGQRWRLASFDLAVAPTSVVLSSRHAGQSALLRSAAAALLAHLSTTPVRGCAFGWERHFRVTNEGDAERFQRAYVKLDAIEGIIRHAQIESLVVVGEREDGSPGWFRLAGERSVPLAPEPGIYVGTLDYFEASSEADEQAAWFAVRVDEKFESARDRSEHAIRSVLLAVELKA